LCASPTSAISMPAPRIKRGKRKREVPSTTTHQEPPSKKRNTSLDDPTSGVTLSKAASTYRNERKRSYFNEESHRAVCTQKTVACEYPTPQPGGPEERGVLHRFGGLFRCVRCDEELREDHNKDFTCHCHEYGMTHDGGVPPPAHAMAPVYPHPYFSRPPKIIAQRQPWTSTSSLNSESPVPSSPMNLDSVHTPPTSPICDSDLIGLTSPDPPQELPARFPATLWLATIRASMDHAKAPVLPYQGVGEEMWRVDEITAESEECFRVRWSSDDPATGKPREQSWIRKNDCLFNLVAEWQRKKMAAAEKEQVQKPRGAWSYLDYADSSPSSEDDEIKLRLRAKGGNNRRKDEILTQSSHLPQTLLPEFYPPSFNFSSEEPKPEQWRSFYQVQYTQALAYISALCAANIELEQHARAAEK